MCLYTYNLDYFSAVYIAVLLFMYMTHAQMCVILTSRGNRVFGGRPVNCWISVLL